MTTASDLTQGAIYQLDQYTHVWATRNKDDGIWAFYIVDDPHAYYLKPDTDKLYHLEFDTRKGFYVYTDYDSGFTLGDLVLIEHPENQGTKDETVDLSVWGEVFPPDDYLDEDIPF